MVSLALITAAASDSTLARGAVDVPRSDGALAKTAYTLRVLLQLLSLCKSIYR
jgi:hypothetical protein